VIDQNPRLGTIQAENLRVGLDRRALGRLSSQQKCLWQRSTAADLEGSEISVPIAFRYLRRRIDPEAKAIEVCNADRPISHPFDQMLSDAKR
jgi:hypothetical protein